MAKMYPEYSIEEQRFKHHSEKTVFEILRDKLPADFIVIHSVNWITNAINNRTDGEADFLIIHPRIGLLILEVKAGRISFDTSRGWTSKDSKGKVHRIDPFDQAKTTKKVLLSKWLESPTTKNLFLPSAHAVCFCDVDEVDGQLPLEAHPSIILTRDKLNSSYLVEYIESAFRYAKCTRPLTPEVFDKIRKLFVHSCEFKISLKNEIKDGKERIYQMTTKQFEVLNGLERMKQVAVLGGAGTGKTMMAIEKSIRLADQGLSIAFVCYNQQLAKHLSTKLADKKNLKIFYYHNMVERACALTGHMDQYEKAKLSAENENDFYLNTSPEFLFLAAKDLPEADKYDAIVIDEAQDFAQKWVDSILAVTKLGPKCHFYVFYDETQNIYNRDFMIPENMPPFVLDRNLRNTEKIHDFSKKFTPADLNVECHSGITGENVEVRIIKQNEDPEKLLREVLNTMLLKGLAPKDVAVLSGKKIKCTEHLKNLPITTKYEERESKVTLNTIHSFKGMESPVVIINNIDHFTTERDEKLFYVASTRAQLKLVIICTEATSEKFQLKNDIKRLAA